MEYALAMSSLRFCSFALFADDATVPLPPHLNDLAILNQNRHGALPARNLAHASARQGIGFYVVLDKLTALPLQPLAHLASVRTASRSIKFKHKVHTWSSNIDFKPRPDPMPPGSIPPTIRVGRGKSKPALLECAGCNHSSPPPDNQPGACA